MVTGKEKGSALLLALILLLVLSLLAVSGMQGSLLQERMSSAQREGVLALEAAESGAQDAEGVVEDLVTVSDFGQTGPLIDVTDEDVERPDPFDPELWKDGDVTRQGDAVGGITPQYYIEYLGEGYEPEEVTDGMITGYSHETGGGDTFAFRVVARATGPSGKGQRIIEVYYARKL